VSAPVLHLLAGPNGAGKSTFVARVLQPVTHLPFVNADEIAAERWPGEELAHAYQASRAAADERRRLLARGESFITETVFSHHSKVALVTQAVSLGYLVNLHVILVPADLAVQRVAERVRRGGHEVPEDKIRERYARLLKLVVDARALADRSTFYDNSTAKHPFRVVATYERGRLVGTANWPAWTPTVLTRS
jgi:predicted ABC-type ATPase